MFDAEKTLHDRFSKFDKDSEQPEFNVRGRRQGHEQSIGRNRINRKSARPIFLSRR